VAEADAVVASLDLLTREVLVAWSDRKNGQRSGGALTLIEAEALEDVGLTGAQSRRQVVVRGVRLNELVGKRFMVGSVECLGVETTSSTAAVSTPTSW